MSRPLRLRQTGRLARLCPQTPLTIRVHVGHPGKACQCPHIGSASCHTASGNLACLSGDQHILGYIPAAQLVMHVRRGTPDVRVCVDAFAAHAMSWVTSHQPDNVFNTPSARQYCEDSNVWRDNALPDLCAESPLIHLCRGLALHMRQTSMGHLHAAHAGLI